MKILVTGCAGFIGSNLVDKLLANGHKVIGIDNFNNYYDPKVKEENVKNAQQKDNFRLYREDILNFQNLQKIFSNETPDTVVHLAARAGVRPSIEDPLLYTQVNVEGTLNLLKLSADNNIEKFIFGSSSSVYGNSQYIPFKEDDTCSNIISPYGASKKAAEFFVETFYHTYKLKSIILRFFTVYGPRGRLDMAPAIFSSAILGGKIIKQFGDGTTSRDYTYIDDIVGGIIQALKVDLEFEIINLGNSNPVKLSEFIKTLEKVIDKSAKVDVVGRQKGDVEKTWANVSKAKKLLDWNPKVEIKEGLEKYIEWLRGT